MAKCSVILSQTSENTIEYLSVSDINLNSIAGGLGNMQCFSSLTQIRHDILSLIYIPGTSSLTWPAIVFLLKCTNAVDAI